MNNNSLVIFTKAALMLAEADTIQKAKELKSLALTAADWAKRKGMGEEAIQHCRSYALEAERRMGEMLAKANLQKGGRPPKTASSTSAVSKPPTLKELGLNDRDSAQAQALAALPRSTFEEIKAGKKTRAAARREVKRAALSKKVPALPSSKFRVLYADPPWSYNDKCDNGAIQSGGAETHYPSMTISELCAMPISDLAEDNAVLFLWTTSPLLFECEAVFKAWGFTYKASFVWDKIKHNMGHYNSVRHEFLLVCTKGSCTPDKLKLFDSVQSIAKTKHSAKPKEFRDIIDTLYPHGRRLELFARQKSSGWETYGNES